MIYDIRSSGNQAQCALRKVAEIFKDKYSNVHQIILKLTYMNDCMVGDKDKEEPTKRQDDLQMVLGCGGFNLKGFTVSDKDPDELLTSDGVSVSVAGQRWFSSGRSHIVGYELNFAKKRRGKKTSSINHVPENLSKRHCASKVGEIFDFTGIVTPLLQG